MCGRRGKVAMRGVWEREREVTLSISSAPALWFLWGTDVHNLIQCLIPLHSLSPVPAPPTVCKHTQTRALARTHILSLGKDSHIWQRLSHVNVWGRIHLCAEEFLLSVSLCAQAAYPVLESTLDIIRCHFLLCQFALLLVSCDPALSALAQPGSLAKEKTQMHALTVRARKQKFKHESSKNPPAENWSYEFFVYFQISLF